MTTRKNTTHRIENSKNRTRGVNETSLYIPIIPELRKQKQTWPEHLGHRASTHLKEQGQDSQLPKL